MVQWRLESNLFMYNQLTEQSLMQKGIGLHRLKEGKSKPSIMKAVTFRLMPMIKKKSLNSSLSAKCQRKLKLAGLKLLLHNLNK